MEGILTRNRKVLLLVAHPDDETIFCGGTLLLYPDCEWTVISVTDDGRPEAFMDSIKRFKDYGVNIVSAKTLDLKNIKINKEIAELQKEKEVWRNAIRGEDLSPEVVLTHNVAGEYGHGAHKLLSVVVDELFRDTVKFVLPIIRQPLQQAIFQNRLDSTILLKKREIFINSYPTEQYIWEALKPLMDYEFGVGIEVFTKDLRESL